MTEPVDPGVPRPDPEPDPEPVSRRWLLRTGGLLGLAAGGVIASGAAAAGAGPAADTPDPAGVPDSPGAFGQPPTAPALQRQRQRSAAQPLSRTDVRPGVAAAPDPVSAPGARLQPHGPRATEG